MALRYILFILATIVTVDVSAQIHSVNQLYTLHRQYKKNVKTDSVAINQLLKIATWHYEASLRKAYPRSIDSVYYYGAKVTNLSKSEDYKIGEGKILLIYSQSAYDSINLELALKRSQKALNIFQEKGYKPGIAEACLSIAQLLDHLNPHNKIYIEHAQKAREIYKSLSDLEQEGVAMIRMGLIYASQSDYPNSLTSYQESLRLFKLANYRKEHLVECQLGISNAFYNQGKLKESLPYLIEATQLAEALDPSSFITARCLTTLGQFYHKSGEKDKASEYFKKALVITENYTDEDLSVILANNLAFQLNELDRPHEALFYVKILESKNKISEWAKVYVVARSLFTYSSLKDIGHAKKYAIQAEQMINSTPESRLLVILYSPLAKYYYETRQYDLARQYLEKYKVYALKNTMSVNFEYIHKQLFKIDSVQNHFGSAINNLSLSYKYRDSLVDKETKNRISELNIKYDVFKKDKDLEIKDKDNKLLVKQNELQSARISHMGFTRKVSIIGLISFAIVIGLLYSRFKTNKKNNQILQAKQTEITKSYEAMKRLLDEKEWLLKEIHHRVKNNLHIVMSLLKSQSYFLEDQAALAAMQYSQHRIQSMSLIHQKLYMSDNMTTIRMREYVSELVAYLEESFSSQKDIQFHLKIEDVEMDVSQAVPLGLILNEAITNCYKYAFPDQKGNIWVLLENTVHDTFCLEINDDGVGMPLNLDIKKTKSLGMKLINGLTEDLEGTLQIDSNQGTRIKVEFIYKQQLLSS